MTSCGFQFDTTYTDLPKEMFSFSRPAPSPIPRLIMLNQELAESLGLTFKHLSDEEQAALFSGNHLPKGATPFAQAYAGHQYGHFTVLGDGRAHMWGEHVTPNNERIDIQFKGSGQTPYSRRGDGKAVLGPMLREYIISEAMHHMGIPTTRSLAVVTTGEPVMREDFLPGAILTRTAKSHIRVGTFEFAAHNRDLTTLSALLDYTIQRHCPTLEDNNNNVIALLRAVMEKQVDLIVHWMRVGFIHGVMNTDNMTLSGETIDYGPCAFMNAYNPNTVFSSIDRHGRYAYGNQPHIAQWNIARLAEALVPLIDSDIKKAIVLAEELVNDFPTLYRQKWLDMMRQKLGLEGDQPEDASLVTELLDWMQVQHADYTNTFRFLSQKDQHYDRVYEDCDFVRWHEKWMLRLQKNTRTPEDSRSLMTSVNPAIIPRNHMVEQALEVANTGDTTQVHTLLDTLSAPYEPRTRPQEYLSPPGSSEHEYQTFCGT